MGNRDRWLVESFIEELRKEIGGFGNLSYTHQWGMARLISLAGTKRRQHRKEAGHAAFHYKELEKMFGRGIFSIINDALKLFSVKNWSHSGQLTSAYKISNPVKHILHRYLTRKRMPLSRLVFSDGKIMRTAPKVLASKCMDESPRVLWRLFGLSDTGRIRVG